MTEIHTGFDGMAAFVQGPIVTVPPDVLYLLQRVAERIFA
jgi:hypothetical protein